MNNLPEWLNENENYEVKSDKDGWLAKSALSIVSKLNCIRSAETSYGRLGRDFPALLKLLIMFAMIVAISLAHNMAYVFIAIAVILVHLCFLSSEHLRRTIASSMLAVLISLLILLPSVFLGSPKSMITVSLKVFACVSLVGILTASTRLNRLTASLARLHIPSIFIFTLDITLKYIVILGDICLAMLNALSLRSIGRNTAKAGSLSGILGFAFLKSRSMADEMLQAMECRGFDGDYK